MSLSLPQKGTMPLVPSPRPVLKGTTALFPSASLLQKGTAPLFPSPSPRQKGTAPPFPSASQQKSPFPAAGTGTAPSFPSARAAGKKAGPPLKHGYLLTLPFSRPQGTPAVPPPPDSTAAGLHAYLSGPIH